MHDHRAMRLTVTEFDDILINGVNINHLPNVDLEDAFTKEDRRHVDFSKFFKRYDFKDDT